MIDQAKIDAGAQALANDCWHPPQPLASLSKQDERRFKHQAQLVLEAAATCAVAQGAMPHMCAPCADCGKREPCDSDCPNAIDLSEPPFAFRFEYADKSAFEVLEDGRAFVVSADGSKRHEPRGKITSNIRRLIGRALLLRSRAERALISEGMRAPAATEHELLMQATVASGTVLYEPQPVAASVVKALEPFAKAADLFDTNPSFYGDGVKLGTDAITVGDLRNARAALTAARDTEGEPSKPQTIATDRKMIANLVSLAILRAPDPDVYGATHAEKLRNAVAERTADAILAALSSTHSSRQEG